jgi:hypothetical protein
MKMNGIDISGGIEAGQAVAVTLPVAGGAQPTSIQTCTKNCDVPDPNGPSLDGIAQPTSIQTCTKNCDVPDPNGPSLDGIAQPQGISTCTKNSAECSDPNGPSLDGLAESDLAISEPTDTLPR